MRTPVGVLFVGSSFVSLLTASMLANSLVVMQRLSALSLDGGNENLRAKDQPQPVIGIHLTTTRQNCVFKELLNRAVETLDAPFHPYNFC